MHETRFNNFIISSWSYLFRAFSGPWRRKSIAIISLLLGYYIGSNVTVYFLQKFGQRPLVVLLMVIIIEILVRLRTNVNTKPWPLYWLSIDNIRIGSVYAVVLEAFKLGS